MGIIKNKFCPVSENLRLFKAPSPLNGTLYPMLAFCNLTKSPFSKYRVETSWLTLTFKPLGSTFLVVSNVGLFKKALAVLLYTENPN